MSKLEKYDRNGLKIFGVALSGLTVAVMLIVTYVAWITGEFDSSVKSKCVEQTKARIYQWDGSTMMMYDENC